MTKIKICGCRTPADIQHAAEAGSDFVGMVVAENTKRYVPTEDRSSLVVAAREFDIPLVCVLRDNPKPQDQSEAERWYPGDMVQWHGHEDESWPLIDPRPSDYGDFRGRSSLADQTPSRGGRGVRQRSFIRIRRNAIKISGICTGG